jgi:hypothetical protein
VSNTSTGGTGGTTATAPTVSITSPTTGAWTGNSINIAMQAASTAGVARIELWGSGKVMTTVACSGTTCTGNYRWMSGSAAKGAYLINAVAYDKLGSRATSATVTIYKGTTTPTYASGAPTGTVIASTNDTTTTTTSASLTGGTTTTASATTADTTKPTAAITSPASGTWTGNSLAVYMKATDNVALKTVALYADGVLAVTTSGTPAVLSCSGATCEGEIRWLSGSLSSGKHSLTAIATDTSGNQATSTAITINK